MLADVVVKPREKEILLGETGGRCIPGGDVGNAQQEVDAAYTLRGGDGGWALGGGDGGGAGRGSRGCGRDDVGVGVEDAAHTTEAVIGCKVEEAVLEDGSADRAAELLLLVNGLGEQERVAVVMQCLELAVGVEGVQGGIAEVVEEVAVDLIGAALGDCVDLATGGLTELG